LTTKLFLVLHLDNRKSSPATEKILTSPLWTVPVIVPPILFTVNTGFYTSEYFELAESGRDKREFQKI